MNNQADGAQTPDEPTDVALARRMLALLDGVDLCAFWACEGPDERPVPMKTCRVCEAVYELRKVANVHVG